MTIRSKITAGALAVKQVFFSIRDAVAYRGAQDPLKDITVNHGDVRGGCNPRVDAALQLSTVWACVRLISGAVATMPLMMYERTVTQGRDTRTIARGHSLYYLLHDSPNADMTASEFWTAVTARVLMRGNAYVFKTYNGAGRLVSLDPLDNDRMRDPYRDENGVIRFEYTTPGGIKRYTDREVWHLKGFSEDGLVGLSVIGVGWRSMVGAQNVAKAASELFGKSMKPDAVLSTKELLTLDQREQMQKKLMGSLFGGEGHRMMLLEATDYKQLTISPLDAQMAQQLGLSVEDLCRFFLMPPSMIGHGTAVSNWGTGREQINLGFLQYVLDPILVQVQQSIGKNLLTPVERLRYYAEFSREGLLRADSAGRAEFYSKMVNNGLLTRNEVRTLENWEPKEGGDDLTVQSALIPVTLLGKSTIPAPKIPEENNAPAD